MLKSNFWYYVFFAIVIIHIIVGFVYLMYKMSSNKKNNDLENKNSKD